MLCQSVDRYRFGTLGLVASLGLVSCSSDKMVTTAADKAAAVEPAPAPPPTPAAAQPPAPPPDPQAIFADWLRERLPAGGRVVIEGGAVSVIHTIAQGDTAESIAKAYLALTDVYRARDLAALVAKAGPD